MRVDREATAKGLHAPSKLLSSDGRPDWHESSRASGDVEAEDEEVQ